MAKVLSRVDEGSLTRFHWNILFAGGSYLALGAAEVALLSFILPKLVSEWLLTPWHVGAIGIASAVGTLLGAPVAGIGADRLGRKHILRLCLLVTTVGTLLGAVSWNYISLAVFQFIVGLGVGGIAPGIGVLVGEFAPARYRGRLFAAAESFWVLGWLLAAFGAYLIIPVWGWRIAFAFGSISLLYVAVQGRLIPESPRFLMSVGRVEEANRFLEMLRTRYGIVQDTSSVPTSNSHQSALGGLRELWSRQLARRTACVWTQWFVLVYTYFGIFIWIPTLLNASGFSIMRTFEFVFVFFIVQLPACVLAAFLVDWIGRKWLLVPSLFIGGVASYFFGGATSYEGILFWGSVVSIANQTGWSVMVGYTAELYPTHLRGTGAGWASAFSRIGAIGVPGAIALLLGTWANGYQMVFIMFAAVMIVGGVLVAILGEETKGRTLEEISA